MRIRIRLLSHHSSAYTLVNYLGNFGILSLGVSL